MKYGRKCKNRRTVPFPLCAASGAPCRHRLGGRSRGTVLCQTLGEPDPRGRVIARLFTAAHPVVDVGIEQTRSEIRAEQQMIDAQAGVALEMVAKVVPE